jgi:hypothetical protein
MSRTLAAIAQRLVTPILVMTSRRKTLTVFGVTLMRSAIDARTRSVNASSLTRHHARYECLPVLKGR